MDPDEQFLEEFLDTEELDNKIKVESNIEGGLVVEDCLGGVVSEICYNSQSNTPKDHSQQAEVVIPSNIESTNDNNTLKENQEIDKEIETIFIRGNIRSSTPTHDSRSITPTDDSRSITPTDDSRSITPTDDSRSITPTDDSRSNTPTANSQQDDVVIISHIESTKKPPIETIVISDDSDDSRSDNVGITNNIERTSDNNALKENQQTTGRRQKRVRSCKPDWTEPDGPIVPKVRKIVPITKDIRLGRWKVTNIKNKNTVTWPEEASDVEGIQHQGGNYMCPEIGCTWFEPDIIGLLNHLLQHRGMKAFRSSCQCSLRRFYHPEDYMKHALERHGKIRTLRQTLGCISTKTTLILKNDANLQHVYNGALDSLRGPTNEKLWAAKSLLDSAIIIRSVPKKPVKFKCSAEGCPDGGRTFDTVPFFEHINKCHVLIRPFGCKSCQIYSWSPRISHYKDCNEQKRIVDQIKGVLIFKKFLAKFPFNKVRAKKSIETVEEIVSENMEEEAPDLTSLSGNVMCPVKDCTTELNAHMYIAMIDHYSTVHGPDSRCFVCPIQESCIEEFNSILDLFNHECKVHKEIILYPELLTASKIDDKPMKKLCDQMVQYHKRVNDELDKFQGTDMDKYTPSERSSSESRPARTTTVKVRQTNTLHQCPKCKVAPMKNMLDLFMHYLTHTNYKERINLFVCNLSPCKLKTNTVQSLENHMNCKHELTVDNLYIFKTVDVNALKNPLALDMYKQYRKSAVDFPSQDEIFQSAKIINQITARTLPQTKSGLNQIKLMFNCPFPDCNDSCPTLFKIIEHIHKIHLKISPFQCSDCDYLSSSPEGLAKHYLDKHGKKRTPNDIMMAVPAFEKAGKFLYDLQKKKIDIEKQYRKYFVD